MKPEIIEQIARDSYDRWYGQGSWKQTTRSAKEYWRETIKRILEQYEKLTENNS